MSFIYICLSLSSESNFLDDQNNFEKEFQSVYKPLVKFLYSHPSIPFTFSISGKQIIYFKKKHPELLNILQQLVARKQVEILGGGFYDPVLPLLFPSDRNGQIDMLSYEIRQNTGKLPRGITLFADCWDSSLVNNLRTCGIDYVLLESSIIPQNKQRFLPLIMTELGKSIEILPYYEKLKELNCSFDDFISNIQNNVEKIEKKDSYLQQSPNRVVNIHINHNEIISLLQTTWLEKLAKYVETQNDSKVRFTTPTIYRKSEIVRIPAFIAAGINGSIAKWIGRAFIEIEPKQKFPLTVYDFMETYKTSRSIYNKIMYVSMLVNQCKNDKMRKKDARDKLWAAQNGLGLLCSSKGAFSNSLYRQQSYKCLMEAEKILREPESFKESISCFDYNSDGLNEYICRMQNYFAYITLISGSIQELEVIKNTGNYADNLSRVLEYDGCADDYERGLFVDHLFTEQQFKKYNNSEPAGDGVFSRVQYTEVKYSNTHHEIKLAASAICLPTKQKVYLRKNYIINSTGMYVQYIIRNDSDKRLNAKFVVESNFAHTSFNQNNINFYDLELVNDGNKIKLQPDVSSKDMSLNGDIDNISVARITDTVNGISFYFEPNEDCGFTYIPLIFNRPDFNSQNIVPVSMTFVTSLFWDIELESGKEIEKTITLTISSSPKNKKLIK
jgi:4-alpha-glucanotransferase